MTPAIKSFRQFLEATAKKIVVTFGRFQPPTIGHEKLLNAVAAAAAGGTYHIYASQSVDQAKNPLRYEEKIKIMRAMFPKHARNIIEDTKVKTIFDILAKAYAEGYTHFTLVVGEDRVESFSSLLQKYHGQKQKNGLFYNFPDGLDVISAGERDPDSDDDVEGMSASKMRAAVTDGDFKSFVAGLPQNYKDPLNLFNLLRRRMGLKEMSSFREHVHLEPLSDVREAYVRGDVFKVGEPVRLKGGDILKIVKRGPNFLVTEDNKKHWLTDCESLLLNAKVS